MITVLKTVFFVFIKFLTIQTGTIPDNTTIIAKFLRFVNKKDIFCQISSAICRSTERQMAISHVIIPYCRQNIHRQESPCTFTDTGTLGNTAQSTSDDFVRHKLAPFSSYCTKAPCNTTALLRRFYAL